MEKEYVYTDGPDSGDEEVSNYFLLIYGDMGLLSESQLDNIISSHLGDLNWPMACDIGVFHPSTKLCSPHLFEATKLVADKLQYPWSAIRDTATEGDCHLKRITSHAASEILLLSTMNESLREGPLTTKCKELHQNLQMGSHLYIVDHLRGLGYDTDERRPAL